MKIFYSFIFTLFLSLSLSVSSCDKSWLINGGDGVREQNILTWHLEWILANSKNETFTSVQNCVNLKKKSIKKSLLWVTKKIFEKKKTTKKKQSRKKENCLIQTIICTNMKKTKKKQIQITTLINHEFKNSNRQSSI